MAEPRRKGPSPAAIERISIALVVLLKAGPLRLSDWAHACRPYMSSNDHRSVRRRCMGAEMTEMGDDGRVTLTARGRHNAHAHVLLLAEDDAWREVLVRRWETSSA